jgi:hypothetical protein
MDVISSSFSRSLTDMANGLCLILKEENGGDLRFKVEVFVGFDFLPWVFGGKNNICPGPA